MAPLTVPSLASSPVFSPTQRLAGQSQADAVRLRGDRPALSAELGEGLGAEPVGAGAGNEAEFGDGFR